MKFIARGILIDISFWFVAVVTLLLIIAPKVNGAWFFAFCIAHESGHLIAMFVFGNRPKKIEFGYFGMRIVTGSKLISPAKEIITAAAGPVINIILAAAFGFCGLYNFSTINIALAVFNLLPVAMLDGGRILDICFPDSRVCRNIGLAVCILLVAVGAAVAIFDRKNFVILIVSLYLLIGVITTIKPQD